MGRRFRFLAPLHLSLEHLQPRRQKVKLLHCGLVKALQHWRLGPEAWLHPVLHESSVAQALVELLVLGTEANEGVPPDLNDDELVLAIQEIFIQVCEVLNLRESLFELSKL